VTPEWTELACDYTDATAVKVDVEQALLLVTNGWQVAQD